MKRWLSLILVLLLAGMSLSGCGKAKDGGESSAGSEESGIEESTAAPADTSGRPETEPEWLVNFGSRALYGYSEWTKDDTLATEIIRTEEVDEQEVSSCAFSLTKDTDTRHISATGSVMLSKDASSLFDLYVEEDAEDPYAAMSDANAFLSEMIASLLAETDKSAPPLTLTSNGIDWKYGFARYTEEEGGASVLNFYAFSLPEDTVIYISAGAYVSGGEDADAVLDKAQDGYTQWLKSLALGEAVPLPEDE